MSGLRDSGHFYTRRGDPAYTVPYAGKRMGERPTTVADARKLNLVPSVTTVERVIAAPQLENWKARQVLMAAATLPRDPAWTDDEWMKAVEADAKEQAKAAAERGSAIHGSLELALRGSAYSADHTAYVDAVYIALRGLYDDLDQWYPEESFSHPLGFGGKVDCCTSGVSSSDHGIVVDFKTKEFTLDDVAAGKIKGYDNHARQLAAYREGLKMPKAWCFNIFISTSVPGLTHVYEWPQDDIAKGWQQFRAALELWKALKGFDPSFTQGE